MKLYIILIGVLVLGLIAGGIYMNKQGIIIQDLFAVVKNQETYPSVEIDNLRSSDSVEINNGLTKSYNASEKQIEIKKGEKILIDIKLVSPYNVLVGRGEDVKVAEFYLSDFNIDGLFDSIDSYDINENYKPRIKDYWFKYGVDYLDEECYNLKDYSPEIKEDVFYCENVTKTNWISFSSLRELPTKSIKIGMFTNITNEKKIEWVGNLKGFDILEWASYEIVGLATYQDNITDYSVDNIRSLAVTPDGNYLITSSYADDYVSIMNITNKSAITGLATFTDSAADYSIDGIYSLAVTSDGNYLITSSYVDDYVSIMNITNKSAITGLATFTDNITDYSIDGIYSLAVTPDGNYLITSSNLDDYVSIMQFGETADTTPPIWSSNSTNSTTAGTLINHSVVWTDTGGLANFTFSFDNGTGTLANDSSVSMTGTSNQSSVLKFVNQTIGSTIRWQVWAWDSTGNNNGTSIFSYLTTSAGGGNCWTNDTVNKLLIIPNGCVFQGSLGL